jgi:hypothetical protein
LTADCGVNVSSNFLQWNPTSANQETDAEYNSDAQRTGGAPVGSEFPSATGNKLFYQVSTMVAALAAFVVNQGYAAQDANLTTLTKNLTDAITALINSLITAALAPIGVFSAASPGYVKIPGTTLILQWGLVDFGTTEPEGQYGPYSFPIAFPNACLNISLTTLTPEQPGSVNSGDNVIMISQAYQPTTSQFYVWNNQIAGTNATRGFYWFAVGY